MLTTYRITDLVDYINWVYFFHAWGFAPQFAGIARIHACQACRDSWVSSFEPAQRQKAREAAALYADAQRWLSRLTAHTTIYALVELFEAGSTPDDDIVLTLHDGTQTHLPMLRQQRPGADGYCRCLADYLKPLGADGKPADRIGLFATSVSATPPPASATRTLSTEPHTIAADDQYGQLLTQTLSDRLAEAAAERIHQYVRTTLWGYAPDEQLTMDQLQMEQFQGIRPAVGYPCLPDLSVNFLLDPILGLDRIGIRLTEHAMMQPHASVSGLMMAYHGATYFSVGNISDEQLSDYARRRGMPPEALMPYLRKS